VHSVAAFRDPPGQDVAGVAGGGHGGPGRVTSPVRDLRQSRSGPVRHRSGGGRGLSRQPLDPVGHLGAHRFTSSVVKIYCSSTQLAPVRT
jgi:hypothetical protein